MASLITITPNTPSYTHTTLASAKQALSLRLADPGYSYWANSEMGRRIVQALHMWQGLTGYYRQRAQLSLPAGGDRILNLQSLVPQMGFYMSTQDTIANMELSLLEPATPAVWSGTFQFSLQSLTNALQRRRNQFLLDTGIVLTYYLLDSPSEPIGRVQLPQSTIDIRRVAWVDSSSNLIYPVFRDDEFSAVSFNPGWPQDPGLPQVYSAAITPPVSLQLIPQPLAKGQLEMVSTESGVDLNPADVASLLGVPDDYAWAVEMGAMADLFSSDGLTADPSRAKYCESMYQLGVSAAKLNPSVLMAQVNDEIIYTGSIFDLDTFIPSWEDVPGEPNFAGMAGRNIVAFGPVPDQQYSATLDLVTNIPVPVVDTDYLQVGKEVLEVVLDLAQHLCSLKQGGAEFDATQPLLQNFLRVVGVQNSRMAASAFYNAVLMAPAQNQNSAVPRMEKSNANS